MWFVCRVSRQSTYDKFDTSPYIVSLTTMKSITLLASFPVWLYVHFASLRTPFSIIISILFIPLLVCSFLLSHFYVQKFSLSYRFLALLLPMAALQSTHWRL